MNNEIWFILSQQSRAKSFVFFILYLASLNHTYNFLGKEELACTRTLVVRGTWRIRGEAIKVDEILRNFANDTRYLRVPIEIDNYWFDTVCRTNRR